MLMKQPCPYEVFASTHCDSQIRDEFDYKENMFREFTIFWVCKMPKLLHLMLPLYMNQVCTHTRPPFGLPSFQRDSSFTVSTNGWLKASRKGIDVAACDIYDTCFDKRPTVTMTDSPTGHGRPSPKLLMATRSDSDQASDLLLAGCKPLHYTNSGSFALSSLNWFIL